MHAASADAQRDRRLDEIYDAIDDALLAQQYRVVDLLLGSISVHAQTTDALLAILTVTLPAAQRLPARASLYNRVRAVFRLRGCDPALLAGLDRPT